MKKPYEAVIAIIIGFSFFLLVLFASAFNPQFALTFTFLGLGEFLLFITGILLFIDHLRFRSSFNPLAYRLKYYLLVISFVIYLIGVLIWIEQVNTDDILNITYISFFPLLYATYYYFQQIMVPIRDSNDSYPVTPLLNKNTLTEQQVKKIQKILLIPVVLSIVAILAVLVLPLYAITLRTPNYSCTDLTKCAYYYNLYKLDILNFGLATLPMLLLPLLSLIGSVLVYRERESLLNGKFKDSLQLGALLLVLCGFLAVIAYIVLFIYYSGNYSHPNGVITYHTIDSGLVIAFVCFIINAAIALNLYLPFNSEDN